MSTIHLHQTTTSTPEQYVAGLTDFGPGRSKLFGNSADAYLKVHDRGPTTADATEGHGRRRGPADARPQTPPPSRKQRSRQWAGVRSPQLLFLRYFQRPGRQHLAVAGDHSA